MTRAQKIALAMYGPRKPWTVEWSDEPTYNVVYVAPRWSMEPPPFVTEDLVQHLTRQIEDLVFGPRRVLIGGNLGLPCA